MVFLYPHVLMHSTARRDGFMEGIARVCWDVTGAPFGMVQAYVVVIKVLIIVWKCYNLEQVGTGGDRSGAH